jgi:GT2 family glycosyltransferase
MVSLIIPTKDHYDLLQKCVESILEKTLYPNYEIIILDNQTTCSKALNYLEALKCNVNITVLSYNHTFNYSAINNYGVKHAKGEIIGLINNDVEVITEGWLSEMVSHAIREEIGAVGAKLFYDDDTVQHAGVILGIGGVAGHSHKFFHKDTFGYFSRLQVVQNYSAVTGAALVVRKALFEAVGGLDEANLKVAFNDVDLCMKLAQRGYRNLWTPYAQLYHHESKSRGAENSPEKMQRFRSEIKFMKEKYGDRLNSDRYYNVNLTKKSENFGIAV